jgi:hypothetical protein
MQDPFAGTWKLSREKSSFDANHRPIEATMHWTRDASGAYLMQAEGRNAKGEPYTEQPQTFTPDGQPSPVPGLPGLSAVTTQPDSHTIRAECRREDGSLAGEGRYVVSADGSPLVATTAGFDTQLRRFEMRTVWDRE